MKRVPNHQVILTITALVIWLLLYGTGLLMETTEYRLVLAPRSMHKLLPADDPLLKSVAAPGATNAAGNSAAGSATAGLTQPPAPSPYWSFIAAVFAFTPTNLVLLTLTAAFLGGSLSNVVVSSMEDHDLAQLPKNRLAFLSEHPLAAMLRGFVIYLCVIAGLYVALDDPFKDTSPGQYARLAGTLSLVAFVVGYDPTQIESWLRLVPSPVQRGGNMEMRHEVTTQVTQQETVTSSVPRPTPLLPSEVPREPVTIGEPVAVGVHGDDDAHVSDDGGAHRPTQPR